GHRGDAGSDHARRIARTNHAGAGLHCQSARILVERECWNEIAVRCAQSGLQRVGKAQLFHTQPYLADIYGLGHRVRPACGWREGCRSLRIELPGLGGATEMIFKGARWPALLVVVALALAVIYRYGPSREKPRWRWISWGSALAAVCWIGVSI